MGRLAKAETAFCEEVFHKLRIDDWVTSQRRRKWRLAGHMARRRDNRWSHLALIWEPVHGRRKQGHPMRRWADELDDVVRSVLALEAGLWIAAAHAGHEWKNLEDAYAKKEHCHSKVERQRVCD